MKGSWLDAISTSGTEQRFESRQSTDTQSNWCVQLGIKGRHFYLNSKSQSTLHMKGQNAIEPAAERRGGHVRSVCIPASKATISQCSTFVICVAAVSHRLLDLTATGTFTRWRSCQRTWRTRYYSYYSLCWSELISTSHTHTDKWPLGFYCGLAIFLVIRKITSHRSFLTTWHQGPEDARRQMHM